MRGLRTARVIIIDDMPEEAMPIVQALGRSGVGCVHIKGDEKESLPAEPLAGIRLVFLDMKLGTSQGARATGAHTANVFANCVSDPTAPILVILWTQHPDYVDEFKVALFNAKPGFRKGLVFASLDKPAFLRENHPEAVDEEATEPADVKPTNAGFSSEAITKLKTDIESKLKELPPLEIIWAFEQLAHDAATSATQSLSAIASNRSKIDDVDDDESRARKWLESVSHLYQSLILSAAGKNTSEETAFSDLLSAVVEINRDRLDVHANVEPVDMTAVRNVKWSGPDDVERAELNSMFLTAAVAATDLAVKPGNIYSRDAANDPKCPVVACALPTRALIQQLLKVNGYKQNRIGAIEANLKKYQRRDPLPHEQIRKDEEELERLWNEVEKLCIPVLLELTPSCDYAQRKRRVARFVAGLLVNDSLVNLIEDAESNNILGPINIPGQNGMWYAVFSALFPFAMYDPENTIKTVPVFRLRPGALLDVQAWFAGQAARPGYLKAEKKQG